MRDNSLLEEMPHLTEWCRVGDLKGLLTWKEIKPNLQCNQFRHEMQIYLGENDESFGVEDEDVIALSPNHQTADAILIGSALLQSADAGDNSLKDRLCY